LDAIHRPHVSWGERGVIGSRFRAPGEREQGERHAAGDHVEDTLEAEDGHDAQTIAQHAGEYLPHQEGTAGGCAIGRHDAPAHPVVDAPHQQRVVADRQDDQGRTDAYPGPRRRWPKHPSLATLIHYFRRIVILCHQSLKLQTAESTLHLFPTSIGQPPWRGPSRGTRSRRSSDSQLASLMQRLPGTDLGAIYPTLTRQEKYRLASRLVAIQERVRSLPPGSGFGYAQSYDDPSLHRSWLEVLLAHQQRSRQRLRQSGVASE